MKSFYFDLGSFWVLLGPFFKVHKDPLPRRPMEQATGSKKGRSDNLNGKELGPENPRQLGARIKSAFVYPGGVLHT
jgi:hypothetical protein